VELNMPIRQLSRRTRDPEAQSLLERLVAEWQHPDPKASQPIILEEREGPGKTIHVYVIWDDWGSLSGVERSEIIVDAFEQRYGQQESLDLTVAMGLTPVEADRMGIK
jgi:hypothetical protein